MRLPLMAAVTAVSLLVVGCASPPTTPTGNLAGVWQVGGGDAVLPLDPQLPATYLVFGGSGSSGTLHLYGSSPANVLACVDVLYAVPARDTVLLYSTQVFEPILLRTHVAGASLQIVNEFGETLTLTAAPSIPTQAVCDPSSNLSTLPDIPLELASGSGLMSDGASLWVAADDGKVYPVDASTGALGTGQDLASSYDHAMTMQGGDFWGNCYCGGSPEAARVQVGGTVVDIVDTDVDFGKPLSVRAGAWDGSHLWLAGYSRDDGTVHLYKIDSDAEPDVLVQDFPFPVSSISSLTFAGGSLWAVVWAYGQSLVQIDPSTGRATRTIALPPITGSYRGVAVLGGQTYITSDTYSGTFSLHRIGF